MPRWTEKKINGGPSGSGIRSSSRTGPNPSPEITAKTQELIAGAPDFFTKLTRITEYIQKNVRYFVVERGIGGEQAHFAADIFRNRYGDCKDKTTLADLHAAGGGHPSFLRARSITAEAWSILRCPSLRWRSHDHRDRKSRLTCKDPRLMAVVNGEGRQALSDLRSHRRAHAGGQSALGIARRLWTAGSRALKPDCAVAGARSRSQRHRCEPANLRSMPTAP